MSLMPAFKIGVWNVWLLMLPLVLIPAIMTSVKKGLFKKTESTAVSLDNSLTIDDAHTKGKMRVGYCDRGMMKEKRLPFPSSLRTSILPPCASTRLLTIASPRPAPPVARVRDLSTL